MSALDRDPNTHECRYFGRKMSNIITYDKSIQSNYIHCFESDLAAFVACVGSDNDDEIYFDDQNGETLRERVKMSVAVVIGDCEHYIDIDLEDILKFSAQHCRGIYKRVLDSTCEAD